jgi:hypothetical protein
MQRMSVLGATKSRDKPLTLGAARYYRKKQELAQITPHSMFTAPTKGMVDHENRTTFVHFSHIGFGDEWRNQG